LVAGDLFILEPGSSNSVSDIVRFNPAGTGSPGYPASAVFYSDTADADPLGPTLADTGFPAAFYTNQFVVRESALSPEIPEGVIYTPTAGQPGFIAGFAATYVLESDVIPEPSTFSGLFLGVVALAALAGRKRRN
jgi:hypothetical protein